MTFQNPPLGVRGFKSVPAAPAGNTLFLLLHLIFYRNKYSAGCITRLLLFISSVSYSSVLLSSKLKTKRMTIMAIKNFITYLPFFLSIQ